MSPRQQLILQAIVETYAKTAEPVGSAVLVAQFDASSATLRAEMAELERGGYIMQPHISAGRVPTDKGYRAYVNVLVPQKGDERTELAMTKKLHKKKTLLGLFLYHVFTKYVCGQRVDCKWIQLQQ